VEHQRLQLIRAYIRKEASMTDLLTKSVTHVTDQTVLSVVI